MKNTFILLIVFSLFACNNESSIRNTTAPIDYDKYLVTDNPSEKITQKELEFWQERLDKDSIALVSLSKLAGSHAGLFSTTGNIDELYESEALIKKAYEVSSRNKDSYLRTLAHNYISQHRFKEAKTLLDSAYTFPDNKHETELMLFDVTMELGDYETANKMLGKVKKNNDFNYLIRQAKWNDHQGNLDAAIRNLEQAKEVAESGGNKGLRLWIYTNLGDFYGHAGRIMDAYNHYLMALKIQPDNSYAKKQIAWIIYSNEKNTQEANRILDSVMVNHKVPDYHLIKSQMAEFDGNNEESQKQQQDFLNAVSNGNYGHMYNTYLINVYAEINPDKALEIAQREINNRATPETYQLLAYSQLQTGKKEEALQTIEKYVEGKTFEPKALYHAALIYKANGMMDKVKTIKEELKEASFEVGPLMAQKIENL